MATKYASLRGKIPGEPKPQTEKEQKIAVKMAQYSADNRTLLNLTAEYNKLQGEAERLKAQHTEATLWVDAVERLIGEQLDAQGADRVSMNGFTWGFNVEPYPSADGEGGPGQIVEYFKAHGMEEQLNLSATELASRLKMFVKEEALANELIIEETTVADPVTGEERTVNVVRSKIPGVKVFLRSSLSRVKSGK